MRAKKILEINLQSKEDTMKAHKFNIKNNYEYILIDDNNLIDYNNLVYLLRIGYTLQTGYDTPALVYKTYDFEREKVKDEDVK